MTRSADVFTGADVARFCAVDLKTIHAWASKGKLRHRRTEGRHLRVQRVDLVAFMRAYEMPLPDALAAGRPSVVVIDSDASALARMRRALEKRFTVATYEDGVLALLSMGASPPQLVVARHPVGGVDLAHAIAAVRRAEATGHVRFVVVGNEPVAGAAAIVAPDKASLVHVREALERLAGMA